MAASHHHHQSMRLLLLALLLAVSTAFLAPFKQPARPQRAAAVGRSSSSCYINRPTATGMRLASAVGGGVDAGAGAAAKCVADGVVWACVGCMGVYVNVNAPRSIDGPIRLFGQ